MTSLFVTPLQKKSKHIDEIPRTPEERVSLDSSRLDSGIVTVRTGMMKENEPAGREFSNHRRISASRVGTLSLGIRTL